MTEPIYVDPDEINQKVANLESLISDITTLRDQRTAEIQRELVAEASRGTRDGGPAPIFVPVIDATKAALDRLNANFTTIIENIEQHIEALQAVSNESQSHAEETADNIAAMETDLGD